jgi:DNA repair protein REV1
LALPARSPKPTFSTQKLTALPQLRDAVSEWVREFKEEGPYDEDVDALVKYLGRVVKEEGDMDKAVAVVRWFVWVLGEEFESTEEAPALEEAKGKWEDALDKVRMGVRSAVQERGLGEVDV